MSVIIIITTIIKAHRDHHRYQIPYCSSFATMDNARVVDSFQFTCPLCSALCNRYLEVPLDPTVTVPPGDHRFPEVELIFLHYSSDIKECKVRCRVPYFENWIEKHLVQLQ